MTESYGTPLFLHHSDQTLEERSVAQAPPGTCWKACCSLSLASTGSLQAAQGDYTSSLPCRQDGSADMH